MRDSPYSLNLVPHFSTDRVIRVLPQLRRMQPQHNVRLRNPQRYQLRRRIILRTVPLNPDLAILELFFTDVLIDLRVGLG